MKHQFYRTIPFLLYFTIMILSVGKLIAQNPNRNIDSLITRIDKTENHEKVDVLNELAKEYLKISPDKTLAYSEDAHQIAKELHYLAGEAAATKNLGTGYMYLSNFDSAYHYLNLSLQKHETSNDSKGIAAVLTNIGNIHSMRREYTLALENYSKALLLFEELGILENTATLNRLTGIVYENLYDHPKALSYFRKSVELATEIGNNNILAYSYNNIAITYGELSDYENARLYYLKSVEAFERTGNLRGAVMAKANLASIYANLDDYENAIKLVLECIEFFKEVNDGPGYAMYLSNLGMMYSRKGKMIKPWNLFSRHWKYTVNWISRLK